MSNVDMTPSQDDEMIPFIDEHEGDTGADDASGTSPESLSFPDQAPRVELVAALTTAVQTALENDRKQRTARQQGYLENQAAGYVSFQRYFIPAGQVIQIAREKLYRSSALIVCYSGTASIGLHAGILPLGTDTVAVIGAAGGVGREIETIQALWATSATDCTLDVQEEYGA